MVVGRDHFRAGQLISHQVDFVNQRRQALRADEFYLTFEGQLQKRDYIFSAFTIQAYFFIFCVHGFSNLK
jgi:hypothetical protein